MAQNRPIGWRVWSAPLLGVVLGVWGWVGACLADTSSENPLLLVVAPDRPPYMQLAAAVRPEGWSVRVIAHVREQTLQPAKAVLALGHDAWNEVTSAGYSGPVWVAMVSQRPVGGQGKTMGGLLLEPDMAAVLRQIRLLFPQAKRIGMLFDQTRPPEDIPVARGVDLIPLPIDPSHPVWPLQRLSDERIDLLWPLPHPALYRAGAGDLLWVEMLRRHLPAIAPSPQLLGHGPVAAWQYDWALAGAWLSRAIARGIPLWGRHPVGPWAIDPHVSRLIGIDPERLQRRIEEWLP